MYALYFFRGTHTVILLVDWSILEETFLSFKLLIDRASLFDSAESSGVYLCQAGSDGNLFELLALVESILADHGDVVSDGNSGEPRFVFEGISPD